MFASGVFSKPRFALIIILILSSGAFGFCPAQEQETAEQKKEKLKVDQIPYKIVYETRRTTESRRNWELFMMNTDGSNPVNLTKTANIDEMYPHVSPDGTKICFVADEFEYGLKVRNVYYMNIEDGNRVKVGHNARQPCWSPDGKKIAFLKAEFDRYTINPYSTLEIMIYDIESGRLQVHNNEKLNHLYALCWCPGSEWFLAAVVGGTEYSDTIIAFEADGSKIYDLEEFGVRGCRPEISQDGKRLTWGETDWQLNVADIDFSSGRPVVSNIKTLLTCPRDTKLYHVDFSPDGKYIAFTRGPFEGAQQVGGFAKDWNICITDLEGNWVQITTDGNHNKEPDWVPIAKEELKQEEQKSSVL